MLGKFGSEIGISSTHNFLLEICNDLSEHCSLKCLSETVSPIFFTQDAAVNTCLIFVVVVVDRCSFVLLIIWLRHPLHSHKRSASTLFSL